MTIIPETRMDHRKSRGSQGEKEKTTCPIVCSVPLILKSNQNSRRIRTLRIVIEATFTVLLYLGSGVKSCWQLL